MYVRYKKIFINYIKAQVSLNHITEMPGNKITK